MAKSPTHTDEQKEEVKRARTVIKRCKAVLGGGGVENSENMTLTQALK